MRKIAPILLLTFMILNVTAQTSFLTGQKRYNRVRTAIKEKENKIIKTLQEKDIELGELNILILAYKAEGELEIYVKKQTEQEYKKLVTYKICSKSGQLGPKNKQGDYPVPEGFYKIDRFNPSSNFYLSLGINYPNTSDRKRINSTNLGGDIFIHGSCVTIGCLPMTDSKIKEIYLYAINAKNNGQKQIPVYILPFQMTEQKFNMYKEKYSNDAELIDFWSNIKSGYDKFEKDKKELNIAISKDGEYIYN